MNDKERNRLHAEISVKSMARNLESEMGMKVVPIEIIDDRSLPSWIKGKAKDEVQTICRLKFFKLSHTFPVLGWWSEEEQKYHVWVTIGDERWQVLPINPKQAYMFDRKPDLDTMLATLNMELSRLGNLTQEFYDDWLDKNRRQYGGKKSE